MSAAIYNISCANFYSCRSFTCNILKRNQKISTSLPSYKRKRLSPNASQGDNMCTVENIHGCRIHQLDRSKFRLEFLISFEDSSHSVWYDLIYFVWLYWSFIARVPAKNVAEDIRAKFSKEWWALCREEVCRSTLYLFK